uniref:Retrotransposon gag domain-containing protein n=1 Tax=Photinus pyralis TaxID=7054 RepID=A0A1Y1MYH0_PHOPY
MDSKPESGIDVPTDVSAEIIPGSVDVPEGKGEVSTMGLTTMQEGFFAQMITMMSEMRTENKQMNNQLGDKLSGQIKEINKKIENQNKTTAELRQDVVRIMNEIRQDMQESVREVEKKTDGNTREIRELRTDMAENISVLHQHHEGVNKRVMEVENQIRMEVSYTQQEFEKVEKGFCHMQEVCNKNKSTSEEELKELRKELENKPRQGGIQYANNFKGDLDRLEQFTGKGKVHPMTFLKILEATILNNRRIFGKLFTNVDEISLIRSVLKEDAQIWYDTVDEKIANFESFKENFISQYWGDWEQNKTRDQLNMGKYNRNRGSRVKYLMENYSQFKHLENGIQESVLVRRLAKHYEEEISQKVTKDDITTYEEFLRMLKRYDTADEEKDAAYDYKIREQGRQYEKQGYGNQWRGNRPYGAYQERGNRMENLNRNYNNYNNNGNYNRNANNGNFNRNNNNRGNFNREFNYEQKFEREYQKDQREQERRPDYARGAREERRGEGNAEQDRRRINQILKPTRDTGEENKIEVVRAEVHPPPTDF